MTTSGALITWLTCLVAELCLKEGSAGVIGFEKTRWFLNDRAKGHKVHDQ